MFKAPHDGAFFYQYFKTIPDQSIQANNKKGLHSGFKASGMARQKNR
jgi:hypothetical protein